MSLRGSTYGVSLSRIALASRGLFSNGCSVVPGQRIRASVGGGSVSLVAYVVFRTTTWWWAFSAIVSQNAVLMGLFVGQAGASQPESSRMT